MKQKLLRLFLVLCSFSLFAQEATLNVKGLENSYRITLSDDSKGTVTALITDAANKGNPYQLFFPKDTSVYHSMQMILANLENSSGELLLEIPGTDLVLKMESKDVPYETLFTLLDQETFVKIIRRRSVYIKEQTSFEDFIKSIKKDSVKPLIPDAEILRFERRENDSVVLNFNDTDIIRGDDENGYYGNLYQTIKDNGSDSTIIRLLIPEDHFKAALSFIPETSGVDRLSLLLNQFNGSDDFTFLQTVSLTDGSSLPFPYEVGIRPDTKERSYTLRWCDTRNDCTITQKMGFTASQPVFESVVKDFITHRLDPDGLSVSETDLALLYEKIRGHNENTMISASVKPFRDTIADLVQRLENAETRYSGQLKLNERVPIYNSIKYDISVRKFPWLSKNKRKTVSRKKLVKNRKDIFSPQYATVRFYNNKAKEIVVVGSLSDRPGEFVTINFNFSVFMRSMNDSWNYVPLAATGNNARGVYLDYNDLFQYYPYDSSFNYAIRNKEYTVKAGDTVKIEQRKLMDYFTAVIFSDFLGLNNTNANALLQAEGRVKVPLWLYNKGVTSFVHSIGADINATVYNGFDDTSRHIEIDDTRGTSASGAILNDTISRFDQIRYSNLNAGINLGLFNVELKGLSTDLSLLYGLRYYRTGLKHNFLAEGKDQSDVYQLNVLSHEVATNFEIRPEMNFGADLNIALNWLNEAGHDKEINIHYLKDDGKDNKLVLRLYLNLYSKLNPDQSNTGIYARLGGFYHPGSKSYHPQILVGYATNLSSFVNRFRKE
ncbi:hypothetical protein [Sinomicrobium soli]|uniref:hypothetical protein n=1 Tax=Sinomicrobium sp. N-1-3-6 TaxID=2219864 RepID=UPI000DCB2824|nr:hypothetical protein [Sinomicrobium sp. N-1-3-6]RAV30257.1 hypothetical protein DN748_05580 [Sinomicrobium sp. N-1-3-6]